MEITKRIRELAPSAKEPLFRRLMILENLSYLREKNGIVGFEVSTDVDQLLSGFTLIGIQKHTIYAYVSDLNETPKLILFPPIDKLFDPAFELLELKVTKRLYTDAKFIGVKIAAGQLDDLVKDLTPPEKEVDIPNSVVEQMAEHIKNVGEGKVSSGIEDHSEEVPVKVTEAVKEPVYEEPMMEEPPYDELNGGFEEPDMYSGFDESSYNDYDGYDDYSEPESDYMEPEPEPEEPKEDPRSTLLKAQTFEKLSDVSDYCVGTLGVQRPLAVTLVNKALQSDVSPEYRIDLALKLFCKLFDEKKI